MKHADCAIRDEKIIADYRAGWSMRALAVKYGVRFQRVHQILVKYNVDRRSTGCGAHGPRGKYRKRAAA
jgi:Mor family transcriptional regulator